MRNVAVILAGGSGIRMGNDTPKQFLKLAGKMVIEHTIEVFEAAKQIDEICIISRIDYIERVQELVVRRNYHKVKRILAGGKERYHSSLSAINAYDEECNLIFHDAVRPLVNERIINDCIEALDSYKAVDVAIDTTDTIIRVDANRCIEDIPLRSALRNGQTPQCFRRSTIAEAYRLALQDPNFQTTDDCGVVRKYLPNEPIYVVTGEQFNMKLTHIEDLFLLDKLFQLKNIELSQKKLLQYTLRALHEKVLVVFGGSYGIGADIVRLAHENNCHVYSFSRSKNQVDVTDKTAVQQALQSVYKKEERIDAIINTAGVLYKEPLAAMAENTIQSSIDVNLLGVIHVAQSAYPYLKETHGALLFYTSSSYTRGRMMYSIYSATKAAIVNLVQALAEEWSECDIRVNCINPERTKTPMRTRNFGDEPEGTLLSAEEVAIASLNTIFSKFTGEVVDVRRK
jgi:ribitol-5-phosphate 2-dehydrogenase (NADP+) / D-ribitol-5-phosphate cytidylyltransferase